MAAARSLVLALLLIATIFNVVLTQQQQQRQQKQLANARRAFAPSVGAARTRQGGVQARTNPNNVAQMPYGQESYGKSVRPTKQRPQLQRHYQPPLPTPRPAKQRGPPPTPARTTKKAVQQRRPLQIVVGTKRIAAPPLPMTTERSPTGRTRPVGKYGGYQVIGASNGGAGKDNKDSTRPIKMKRNRGTQEHCQQDPDSGPCRAWIPMFYYEAITESCENKFIFGGCGGNSNRFSSIEECKLVCTPGRGAVAQLSFPEIPQNYTMLVGNCPGGHILESIESVSMQQCTEECNVITSCVGFSYRHNSTNERSLCVIKASKCLTPRAIDAKVNYYAKNMLF